MTSRTTRILYALYYAQVTNIAALVTFIWAQLSGQIAVPSLWYTAILLASFTFSIIVGQATKLVGRRQMAQCQKIIRELLDGPR